MTSDFTIDGFAPELMYKLHLILKYLRKRRIAWVSLIAVMLCTTMVLVVISVMGGWLRMFRDSFHGLTGDVVVRGQSPLVGFPHYEEIIRRLETDLPDVVEAAVPAIQTFGLINIDNQFRDGVQVFGYTPQIGRVNRFLESLYRQYQHPVEQGLPPPDKPSWELLPNVPYSELRPDLIGGNGMIVGTGVVGLRKNHKGVIERPQQLYRVWANLKVLGLTAEEGIDITRRGDRTYWIVDDSRTKIWQYDQKAVYVPFDLLQKDLGMDEFDGIPARTTEVQIRIKPGVDLFAARDRIQHVVDSVFDERGYDPAYPYAVETWEEGQALWLGAIEKEKILVTLLFGIISIVAIFLIFCIFYMIVVEKTKDIGIIKSVGATNTGVAGIFLGYGLAIGLAGASLGLLSSWLIVRNINELHDWLGRRLNVQVWDPEVYAFDTIPNTMDPREVIVICSIAIVASVLGALVPAIRAARMNPVEALRWE